MSRRSRRAFQLLHGFGRVPPGGGGGGGGGSMPAANRWAVFSTRIAVEGYTGPCMEVQNGDNQTDRRTIGFTPEGELDEADLLGWLPAGRTAIVRRWFDQVGGSALYLLASSMSSSDMEGAEIADDSGIRRLATGQAALDFPNGTKKRMLVDPGEASDFNGLLYAVIQTYPVSTYVIPFAFGTSYWYPAAQEGSTSTFYASQIATVDGPSFVVDGVDQAWADRDDAHAALVRNPNGSPVLLEVHDFFVPSHAFGISYDDAAVDAARFSEIWIYHGDHTEQERGEARAHLSDAYGLTF